MLVTTLCLLVVKFTELIAGLGVALFAEEFDMGVLAGVSAFFGDLGGKGSFCGGVLDVRNMAAAARSAACPPSGFVFCFLGLTGVGVCSCL